MSNEQTVIEQFETDSPEETFELGKTLAARFGVGDCVAMVGDLGAGKTAMVRGIAAGLGVDDIRLVSSPTYVLAHEYTGRVPVYHLDLYRMTDPDAELIDLGIMEMLDTGVVLMEWADKADQALPQSYWQITIDIDGPEERTIALGRIGAP
jgi:tRNA threonylcarbamoyladenosine biosynthesis protein TsaE